MPETGDHVADTLPEKQLDLAFLSHGLSSSDMLKVNAALEYLGEIREAVKESNDSRHVPCDPILPERVGRYEILESLGRGGFAEVFLANDSELKRRVALKIPLIHGGLHPDSRQRFEREARLAASLSHPQIIPVYECGSIGPVLFIAFAWCPGPTLQRWLRENDAPTPQLSAELVAAMADAVQYAHLRGIVHRDLKPGNILIDSGDEVRALSLSQRLRIADFGLARDLSSEDPTLTQQGQVLGTPAYMAPEIVAGGVATPAGDIYALGMILFELLTGQLPFRRENQLATLRAIESQSLPAMKSFRSGVPRDLEAICQKCLRRSPVDRYKTADDLAADLRRFLGGFPVLARPTTRFEQVLAWTRRNPLVAGSLSFAFLALTSGLGIALWQADQAHRNWQSSLKQSKRAHEHLATAQAMISDVVNLEQQLRHRSDLGELRRQVVLRAAELQLELLGRERDAGQDDPVQRYRNAMGLKELSPLLMNLGELEPAIENIRRVLQLLDGIGSELPGVASHQDVYATRMAQRMNLVGIYQQQKKFDLALMELAANRHEKIPDSIPAHRAQVILAENYRAQADLFRALKDAQKAIDSLQQGIAALNKVACPAEPRSQWDQSLTLGRMHAALGMHYLECGERGLATENLVIAEQCLPKLKELYPQSPFIPGLEAQITLGQALAFQQDGQTDKAIEVYGQAQEIFKKMRSANPAYVQHLASFLEISCKKVELLLQQKKSERAFNEAEEVLRDLNELPDGMRSYPPAVAVVERLKSLLKAASKRQ